MIIDWIGHSCFKVTLKTGEVIVFDPFDETVGYPQQEIKADIVVISHHHYDHDDLSKITGDYTVVDTPGVHEFGEIKIESIKTWHDHNGGKDRGANLVSVLSVRGLHLCHMGDIGQVPSADVLEKIKGVEILMIPVGGKYTTDAKEALQICDIVEPNIIIPMHFRTAQTSMDIAPLHDFLEEVQGIYDISRHGKCYLTIDKATLKKRTRVVVMECI